MIEDAIAQAARLEEFALTHKCGLMVSAAILDSVQPPSELSAWPLGNFQLRGKEAQVALFKIQRNS